MKQNQNGEIIFAVMVVMMVGMFITMMGHHGSSHNAPTPAVPVSIPAASPKPNEN